MTPPSTIAHYRIVSKLGEGGMGAVYRARDTKLNRDVAVKVLPPAFAEDVARMQRFEREAQVLASLNHPNIAAIYGIEAGAIVMELVEGEDLKGPVPIDTAIAYARQIAAGLEAAHERGIVHRDLKPANIKVAPDGTVKLLDFGLAKISEQSSAASAAASPTMSPTLSLAMTQAGMILGTAAYMSPEQARGKPVDRRADIWAFGVILYELLAGKMLFAAGDTVTDILAAVVTLEPDWSALPAATPPRVCRLLERCLCKEARQRLRDIGEARILLEQPEPAALPPAAAPRRAWLPWAVAGIALLAAGASWLRPRPAESGAVTTRFLLPLPPGTTHSRAGAAPNAMPSPDGRMLAFTAADDKGRNHLWIRAMGSVSAHRVDQTEGASLPFWAPDGQFIAFFADEKLKKVPVSGGAPQALCDMPQGLGRSGGDGGTWNRDGVIVFATGGPTPLMRVSAMGGPATPVTTLEQTGDAGHHWPQFLPDGRHFLYFASFTDPAKNGIYVQELGSTQRVLVLHTLVRAAWTPPGYLLFIRDITLLAQRMNPRTFQLEGEPQSVAEEVGANTSNGRASFAVSENGVLVYRGGFASRTQQLSWVDRQGNLLADVGKPGEYWVMELSPDEKSVALIVGTNNRHDVWVMDLGSGVMTRMTNHQRASIYNAGAWSADSRRIAINLFNGGVQELEVASGKLTTLNAANLQAQTWAPDGRTLLCTNPRIPQGLFALPMEPGSKPQPFHDISGRIGNLRLSPDDKFLAYVLSVSGPGEVVVASFPSFTEKRQISSGGASNPNWRKDGKELFFETRGGGVWSVDIRTGSAIETGIPKMLFRHGVNSGRPKNFQIAADGQRLLVMQPVDKTPPVAEVMVVLNWMADLKP